MFKKDKAAEVAQLFMNNGGVFVHSPDNLLQKLTSVECFVFDWDGVFNNGRKGAGRTSDFAEPDAMGVHTLRFAYWLLHGKLPYVAIITGQNNESAFELAEREHFHAVFAGFKDKSQPINQLKELFDLQTPQVASFFDDIIDYPLMTETGVRFLCKRDSGPLFMQTVLSHKLCDYITYSKHPDFPVREISELIIGLWGNYEQMFFTRFKQKQVYADYWNLRQSVETKFFINEKGKL